MSTRRTDWKKYEQIIKGKKGILEEEKYRREDEQNKYKKIIEIMKEATGIATYGEKFKKNYKENKINKGKEEGNKKEIKRQIRNPVTWWDEECYEVTDERKKKLKEWLKRSDLKNYTEYKRVNAIARKTIRRKKRKA